MGPQSALFEDLVGDLHGAKHAIAVNSCTSALHLSMLALGVGPGDEVIVPAFTWLTTASAVEYVGGTPVFVDVSHDDCNISVASIEGAITSRTKAIVPVHLFGAAADMDPIIEIADSHGLSVVEDAACAIGTLYNGKPVGSLGAIGCFSFHPRKIITTGEGGMATTNVPEWARILRCLRCHGDSGRAEFEAEEHGPWSMSDFTMAGFNFRLSDIQAAIGVAQISRLPELIAERRRLAAGYCERLSGMNNLMLPVTPMADPGHTYQSFVVSIEGADRELRNRVMTSLRAADIETRPGTHAVHRISYYSKKYGLHQDDYPVAAMLADTTISLPMFPGMTDEQLSSVTDTLTVAVKNI